MIDFNIVVVVFVVMMIIAHLVKSIREAAEAAKQQQQQAKADEDIVIITQQKPTKSQKAVKQRPPVRQPLGDTLSLSDSPSQKRQALSKRLGTQGEGQRFEVAPGTLDASQIVAPTIDPTVRPDLGSITGIYEEGAQVGRRTGAAISLNIADYLAKPEGVIQAVILAEILNRPAWQESQAGHTDKYVFDSRMGKTS